jgi:deoxyribonuclease V
MDLFPRAAALAQEPPNLEACLLELIRQIPSGRVSTYGMLAEALGDPAAARWIGQFLAHHSHRAEEIDRQGGSADDCPCHRVLRSDGSLGLYCLGDPLLKQYRLEREGVVVREGRVDLHVYGFGDFSTDYPLRRLRELQELLSTAVRQVPLVRSPEVVGAVDVAYRGNLAVGVLVAMDPEGQHILAEQAITLPARFPYITGFLAFRELPVLCALLDAAESKGVRPDVLLVDGSGMVHPRGVGVASHLGVIRGVATIGVTKTLLCGRLEPTAEHPWISHWITLAGCPMGFAFRRSPRSRHLLYVSPGHLIDLQGCEAIVGKLRGPHPLPEPLYRADQQSKKFARQNSA